MCRECDLDQQTCSAVCSIDSLAMQISSEITSPTESRRALIFRSAARMRGVSEARGVQPTLVAAYAALIPSLDITLGQDFCRRVRQTLRNLKTSEPLVGGFRMLEIFFESASVMDQTSRIQLTPHARRRAVPMTVSEWVPVVCANDEVAKDRRTGITKAYTVYSDRSISSLHDCPLYVPRMMSMCII